MRRMNRRAWLSGFASLLAGCSGEASATAAQLATDVKLIASGLTAAVTSIAAIPGVSAPSVAKLEGYLSVIQADAQAIAAAATSLIPGATVEDLAEAVEKLAPIGLAMLPAASSIAPLLQAALSLLPVILAAAGLAGGAQYSAYSPDDARRILAGG